MKRILVYVLLIGCMLSGETALAQGRYVDNGDNTVTDTKTGLMWQKRKGPILPQREAARFCSSTRLGGYSDWRLPNMHELLNLVDYSRYGPALDPLFEIRFRSNPYWTINSRVDLWDRSWAVSLWTGKTQYFVPRDTSVCVKCVRGTKRPFKPANRLVILSENVVRDPSWKFEWLRANYGCGMIVDGKDDWRYPTVGELATIIDYTTRHSVIDTDFFAPPTGYIEAKERYAKPAAGNYIWVFGDETGSVFPSVTGGPITHCVRDSP